MQKPVNKILYLDGIRGVAAFIVVIHHFLLAFYIAYYNFDEQGTHINNWDVKFGRSIYSVFANGHYCVCIFFVLSGFVLSRSYFTSLNTDTLISGAQRRFARLYIPVAATLIIAFALMKADLFYNKGVAVIAHSEWWFLGQWDFGDVWKHFWQCMLYRVMFAGDGSFDTTMWTISIEFYGSLFVFAFLALTHHTRNRLTMLILAALYCYFTDSPFLAAFVLGISLNYIETYKQALSKNTILIAPFVLLIVGAVLGSFPTGNNIHHTFYGRTPDFIMLNFNASWIHTVGAYLLIVAFVLSPRLQHFISLRLFRFLGYISFSIYLIHPLVLGSLTSYTFLHLYPHFGYNHSALYVFLLTIAVCVPAAWLMTKYIDGPGIRFAKYLYERYVKKE